MRNFKPISYVIDEYINEDGKQVSLCYYGEDKNKDLNLKITIPKHESGELKIEGQGALIWDEGYFNKKKIKEFNRNISPNFFEGMSIFNFSSTGFPEFREKGGIFIGMFSSSIALEYGVLRELHRVDKDRLYQGFYDQIILEPWNVDKIFLEEDFKYVGQSKKEYFTHDDNGDFMSKILFKGMFQNGMRHGEAEFRDDYGIYYQDKLIYKDGKIVSPKKISKEIVKFLVSIDGHFIDDVHLKYMKDKELVILAAKGDHPYVLSKCSNKFRNDIDIVKAATDFYNESKERNDYADECAELIGKRLMHDRDFIRESIEMGSSIIYYNQHAKWVFKDKELMLLEIKKGLAWCIQLDMAESISFILDKSLLKDAEIIKSIDNPEIIKAIAIKNYEKISTKTDKPKSAVLFLILVAIIIFQLQNELEEIEEILKNIK